MLDWNYLKKAEAGWRLSAAQRQRILAGCLQKTAPAAGARWRVTLKPLAYAAVAAAAVFALLFFWPRSGQPVENITVPGTATTPDTPVSDPEPQPSVEQDLPVVVPLPEEGQGEQTEKPEQTAEAARDWTRVHRFWETVPEMSVAEAAAIVKEKASRPEEPLTDTERMALYVQMWKRFEVLNASENYTTERHSFGVQLALDAEYCETLGRAEDFFESLSVKNQPFAESYDCSAPWFTEVGANSSFLLQLIDDDNATPATVLDNTSLFLSFSGDTVSMDWFPHQKDGSVCSYADEEMKTLVQNVLRYYLSLDPVIMANYESVVIYDIPGSKPIGK